MSALRSLLAIFDIKVESKPLEEAEEKIESFTEKLRSVGSLLGEALAVREVKEFVTSSVEAGARAADLSSRLGIAAHDLQAFQFAAGLAGVDAEGAAHSLGLLNRTIGSALTGGGDAATTFRKLGIGLKDTHGGARDVNDVLLDVAGAFEKLPSQQERAAYAMRLFGREGQVLLPVLGKGRQELAATLREFQELGGGMSGEFVAQAKEVDDEQKKLALGLGSIKHRLSRRSSPGSSSSSSG